MSLGRTATQLAVVDPAGADKKRSGLAGAVRISSQRGPLSHTLREVLLIECTAHVATE